MAKVESMESQIYELEKKLCNKHNLPSNLSYILVDAISSNFST